MNQILVYIYIKVVSRYLAEHCETSVMLSSSHITLEENCSDLHISKGIIRHYNMYLHEAL